jgi:hypothetical protein
MLLVQFGSSCIRIEQIRKIKKILSKRSTRLRRGDSVRTLSLPESKLRDLYQLLRLGMSALTQQEESI